MAKGAFGSGNPKLLAFALFGAVNWIPRWFSPDGPATLSRSAISSPTFSSTVCGGTTDGHGSRCRAKQYVERRDRKARRGECRILGVLSELCVPNVTIFVCRPLARSARSRNR